MKHSLTHGAGYLVVDHRDSPGLTPAEVAHVPRALPIFGGELFEADVFTCSHCQRAVLLNPSRVRPRGYCAKCNHYICDDPRCHSECHPIVKLLDQAQEHAAQFIGKEDDPASDPLILLTDRFKE